MARVPVDITLEFTPNPNTLKYAVTCPLLPSGAEYFTSPEAAAAASPLASRLFALGGISAVLIGTDFVTITVSDTTHLRELNKQVMTGIKDHLEAAQPIVLPRAARPGAPVEDALSQRIRQIIDEEIQPAVAGDGGHIEFERFDDGVVFLSLRGACAGCPSSTMTLKMGIEARLREAIPEVKEVLAV